MEAGTPSHPKNYEQFNDETSVGQTADDSCSVTSSSTAINEENNQSWKKSLVIKPKDPEAIQIFIVKRIDDEESTDLCIEMMRILNSFKAKIFVEQASHEELMARDAEKLDFNFYEFNGEEETTIDLLVIIGGDGSILWALQYFQNSIPPPVLAFSKGTLNYLCNFPIENYERSLRNVMDAIISGKSVQIEERSRVLCEVLNKENGKKKVLHGLNEIVIDRGSNSTIVRLDCFLEGKYLATFEGDGVIVATPTGSTAYQLSAGGPIMNHVNSTLAITPIATMNLSTRPLVLPDNMTLTFKLQASSRKSAFLNVDGQTKIEITKDTEVVITGSKHSIPFIMSGEGDTLDNWILRLRNLLGWNRKFM
jgi:NAD+ kinase